MKGRDLLLTTTSTWRERPFLFSLVMVVVVGGGPSSQWELLNQTPNAASYKLPVQLYARDTSVPVYNIRTPRWGIDAYDIHLYSVGLRTKNTYIVEPRRPSPGVNWVYNKNKKSHTFYYIRDPRIPRSIVEHFACWVGGWDRHRKRTKKV